MMQYKNALFISPQNETSHFNLGALLVTSGKVNEGMHYYRAALLEHNRNIDDKAALRYRKVSVTNYSLFIFNVCSLFIIFRIQFKVLTH